MGYADSYGDFEISAADVPEGTVWTRVPAMVGHSHLESETERSACGAYRRSRRRQKPYEDQPRGWTYYRLRNPRAPKR